MSGESARSSHENKAVLRVDAGPVGPPVLARVVAMMLARAECPVDRLDDALIVCDAVSADAPAHSADGHVQFTIATHPRRLELRVGQLAYDGAKRLLADAELPGLGSVIEPIADSVRIETSPRDGFEELVIELGFEPALATEPQGDAQTS
ncbi:MAG: hypothetical protein ACYCU0_13305 [Solirubrobacteraceae bacterium]